MLLPNITRFQGGFLEITVQDFKISSTPHVLHKHYSQQQSFMVVSLHRCVHWFGFLITLNSLTIGRPCSRVITIHRKEKVSKLVLFQDPQAVASPNVYTGSCFFSTLAFLTGGQQLLQVFTGW